MFNLVAKILKYYYGKRFQKANLMCFRGLDYLPDLIKEFNFFKKKKNLGRNWTLKTLFQTFFCFFTFLAN